MSRLRRVGLDLLLLDGVAKGRLYQTLLLFPVSESWLLWLKPCQSPKPPKTFNLETI
jgi:hypothetical protein